MYCFLKFFGVFDGLRVLHLEIFRRLRRATYITPWNFSAPASSYMYYTLKFFGACGELHVLLLEIFRRLQRFTCIAPWNFSAPAASYMYYTLKFFGACGGLFVLPLDIFSACSGLRVFLLENFRRLRWATSIYPEIFSPTATTVLHGPYYVSKFPVPATSYYITPQNFRHSRRATCLTPQIFRRQTYRSLIPSLQIYIIKLNPY